MVNINSRIGWSAGVAIVAIASVVFWPRSELPQGSEESTQFELPYYATPAGITLQPLGKAAGYSLDKQSAATIPRDEIVFADPTGLTLYAYDEDPIGKSVCNDECAETFPPLFASARAEPFGDWSLIARDGGAKQWVLKGKPLYTYSLDIDPGSVAGNSPAATGAPRIDRAGNPVGGGLRGYRGERPEPKILPEGWQPAYLFPMPSLELPPGVAVKEVPDVSAFVLVDIRKHTLYVFDGEIGEETRLLCDSGPCLDQWVPLPAPLIAQPIGDFGVVGRDDGIRQWTYKGKGLHTFSGDLAAGYANGADRRVGWRVAAVTQLFNPPGVSIENTLTRGAVLAANDGMTLYRRDGHVFQSGGGHNLRRGAPKRPAVGRDIGTDPRCGEDCLELWLPFLAPDDAESRGFWEPVLREDGRKQWSYQGYAMWTFAGDQKPGDMLGHDHYDIMLSHKPNEAIEIGTPMAGGVALWWSIAVP